VAEPGRLTAEECLLRDTAREFAQREVVPTAIEQDEQERFDRSIFTRMGELGLGGRPRNGAPAVRVLGAP
jgi:acyl-CoA dehydrogenase